MNELRDVVKAMMSPNLDHLDARMLQVYLPASGNIYGGTPLDESAIVPAACFTNPVILVVPDTAKEKKTRVRKLSRYMRNAAITMAEKAKRLSILAKGKPQEAQTTQMEQTSATTEKTISRLTNTMKNLLKRIRPKAFGVPLRKLAMREDGVLCVPEVMRTLVEFISTPEVLHQNGIFRESGKKSEIDDIRQAIDLDKHPGGTLELSQYDPHAVCGVLKMLLREMPKPLFPYALYKDFLAAGMVEDPGTEVKGKVLALSRALLEPNKTCWQYLLAFLVKCASQWEYNRMGPENLAIVFAPNILRTKVETIENMKNGKFICKAVQWFIEDAMQNPSVNSMPSTVSTVPNQLPGMEGCLNVQVGDSHTRSWKLRLFVLKGTEHVLNYYRLEKPKLTMKKRKLGKIKLSQYEIIDYHFSVHGRDYVFIISHTNNKRNHLMCSADTAKEKDDWVKALKAHANINSSV